MLHVTINSTRPVLWQKNLNERSLFNLSSLLSLLLQPGTKLQSVNSYFQYLQHPISVFIVQPISFAFHPLEYREIGREAEH